jgi:hypothetical protein
MSLKKITSFLLLLFPLCLSSPAQQGNFNFYLQALGGYVSAENVPFWMRSNQFGSVPPPGASLGLIGAVKRDYDRTKPHLADWGISAEGRLNVGNPTGFILLEGYGKARLGIFEFKGGRVKDIMGLCDTSLSSGSFSVSGNNLGIPKVEISIPEFYTIPVFGGLFAFKGNYVHGWIGNWHLQDSIVPNTPTYLHQKSLYIRFGKPVWKLKLLGGFNHQVIWGNEEVIMGEDYELNGFQTYLYVITGKPYNNGEIQETRIGDHLGSIDLGLEYDFKKIHLLIYRQFLYEAGALYYLANLADGLNGVSLVNKQNKGNTIHWNRMLFEFLYTKNQAGETWSPYTASAIEDYYNNGYYLAGWSYKSIVLGTPFINPRGTIRDSLPTAPMDYFVNNRVMAFHVGMIGCVNKLNLITRLSFSRNYGTYNTSATGKQYPGAVYPSPYGVFPVTNQFSGILQISRELAKGFRVGLITALDIGGLYYNSFGLMVSAARTF